jgi:hypothetical protein
LVDKHKLTEKVIDYTKNKANQLLSDGQFEETQKLINITKKRLSRISPQYAKQNVFRVQEAKILEMKRRNQDNLERKRSEDRLNKLIRSFM